MLETIAITLTAIATSFAISYLLERFGKRARLREIQTFINNVNKEYSAALKRRDTARVSQLEKEMKKFPELIKESLILNIRSLIIVLPIFYVAVTGINYVFPTFSITLPLPLPVPSPTEFITLKNTFGPRGWFLISLVIIAGLIQFVVAKIRSKFKN